MKRATIESNRGKRRTARLATACAFALAGFGPGKGQGQRQTDDQAEHGGRGECHQQRVAPREQAQASPDLSVR